MDKTKCPKLTINTGSTKRSVTGCVDICNELRKLNKECREKTGVQQGQVSTVFLEMNTVFARSDAAATIYFAARSCAATIRERRLLSIRRERTTLGTSKVEEAGPFADTHDDEDESEDN